MDFKKFNNKVVYDKLDPYSINKHLVFVIKTDSEAEYDRLHFQMLCKIQGECIGGRHIKWKVDVQSETKELNHVIWNIYMIKNIIGEKNDN